MLPKITNQTVLESRPPKEEMDPLRPHFFLNEQEVQADGELRSVNTIFLTNRECPFKCVMCDLWRHTLDKPTPEHAVPSQIEYALERLPNAEVIKLYNSGNFFDGKAIPRSDYSNIAGLLSGYDHVIVENHPKLTGPFIPEFKKLLNGSFEIAMGLETIHPDVLPRLNKEITPENFRTSTEYLISEGISVRAFILLNPPFLADPQENIEWTLRSVEFALECGVEACSVIPTRDGNGIMEKLRESGNYVPPTIDAFEEVIDKAMNFDGARIFADLWDLSRFSNCRHCFYDRKDRLQKMNLEQRILPKVECSLCSASSN